LSEAAIRQGSQRVAEGKGSSVGGTKLSDALVRALPALEKGYTKTYDAGPDRIRGFGVRLTSSGARSFILNCTVAGIERTMTIGAYPTWSVAAARERLELEFEGIDKAAAEEESSGADFTPE